MSLSTINPLPGPWTLIVDFNQPVVGNEISDAFSGHVRLSSGVSVNSGGLPDNAGTMLARGSTHTFNVKIHNATGTPEDFFLDPRLATTGTVPLAALAPNPLTLPLSPFSSPQLWVIPTESSSVTLSASGATSPVTFDGGSPLGDPDLFSGLPTGGSNNPAPVLFNGFGSQVTSGLWIAVPALATIAGFTAPAPSGATVSLNAAAVTREFDTSMTSPVGDFWLASVNPAAGVALFRINPGQTRTITVTIKVPATATAGSVVSGDVFVDTIVPFVQDAGSETAAIRYAYTVS
jgi:hypothetical protein